jgi:DNA-binding NarL/FixJ family response regulator
VVEDHALMRAVIAQVIRHTPDLEWCGEAQSAAEALDKIANCRPDLVLLDIAMPGMTGLELSHHLLRLQPDLPILIVSGHERHLYTPPEGLGLAPNIKGYVMKHEGAPALLAAISLVLRGEEEAMH